MLARAQRLGILVAPGGATSRSPARRCWRSPSRSSRRGISLDGALAVFEEIEQHCDAVSAVVRGAVRDEVWQPFSAGRMPVERWPEIEESIDRLRPLATEALLAIFGRRMSAQIEDASVTGPRAPAPAADGGYAPSP